MPEEDENIRSIGYNNANLLQASKFAKVDIPLRAEMPLNPNHRNLDKLKTAFLNLHNKGIKKLLIMRTFPSGRALLEEHNTLTKNDYNMIFDYLFLLEKEYTFPTIKPQCALKYLLKKDTLLNPCDAVVSSFSLRWDGLFLASPWAMKKSGTPFSDSWVLGNLQEQKLSNILSSDYVKEFIAKEKCNFGHVFGVICSIMMTLLLDKHFIILFSSLMALITAGLTYIHSKKVFTNGD